MPTHYTEATLFRHTVDSLSLHTPRYRRIWLQRAEKVIHSRNRRLAHNMHLNNERSLMRRWLGPFYCQRPPTQPRPKYTAQVQKLTQTTLNNWRRHAATTL